MSASSDFRPTFRPRDPMTSRSVDVGLGPFLPYIWDRDFVKTRRLNRIWYKSPAFFKFLSDNASALLSSVYETIVFYLKSDETAPVTLSFKGRRPSRQMIAVHADYPDMPVTINVDFGVDGDGLYYDVVYGQQGDASDAVRGVVERRLSSYSPADGRLISHHSANLSPDGLKLRFANFSNIWLLTEALAEDTELRDLIEGWRQSEHYPKYRRSRDSSYLNYLEAALRTLRDAGIRVDTELTKDNCIYMRRSTGTEMLASVCVEFDKDGFSVDQILNVPMAKVTILPAEGVKEKDPEYKYLNKQIENLFSPENVQTAWETILDSASRSLESYFNTKGSTAQKPPSSKKATVRDYIKDHKDEIHAALQADTREFVEIQTGDGADPSAALNAERFFALRDRRGDVVRVWAYRAELQPLLDMVTYVASPRDYILRSTVDHVPYRSTVDYLNYFDIKEYVYLDSDLGYVEWYDASEDERPFLGHEDTYDIFKIDYLMTSDLEQPHIFEYLEYLNLDPRYKIYSKIPRDLRLDPAFNTKDPYREIHPVDRADADDPGVDRSSVRKKVTTSPDLRKSWYEYAEPFTIEDLTGKSDTKPAPIPERVETSESVEAEATSVSARDLDWKRKPFNTSRSEEVENRWRAELESDTRKFLQPPKGKEYDEVLDATRYAVLTDRNNDLVDVLLYSAYQQPMVDRGAFYVARMHPRKDHPDSFAFLDSDLNYVSWGGEPEYETSYEPSEGDRIFAMTPLMKEDLSHPYIFEVLKYMAPSVRRRVYKKIPKKQRTDPGFNTEDPYREIYPVDPNNPDDPGVVTLDRVGPRYSTALPFTFEELTGAPNLDLEIPDEGYTRQTYDMSDPDQRQAIEIAWGSSPEYRAFEANLPNVVDVSELKAARTYLKDLLRSEGVETKAYTRDRDVRLTLDKSLADAYIRIGDPYLDARLENRGSSPIPDGLKSKIDIALGKYATWQAPLRDNITDRQIAAMLPVIQRWMAANGISLVNGSLEDLYNLTDDADIAQSIDADMDLHQRALDEDLEAALRRADSETAARIEAAKDALAQAHAAYVGAIESGDEATAQKVLDTIYSDEDTIDHGEYEPYEEGTIDHGGYDEFEEGTIDHGGYDEFEEGTIDRDPMGTQWGDAEDWKRVLSLPKNEATEQNVEYALSLIDFDRITQDVIESLYTDLDRRGLSKIRNTVSVNSNSGDVYVGAVDGYLEGVALPEGLSFNERRAFVKAIKSFEQSKYDANMEVLAKVASSLGLSNARKEDLLAYPIPQFTVRQDYLNEYVERAQPDEIDALKDEVVDLLIDFEQSPTKSEFNDLAPRIESLFRYDPSSAMYHSFLDRLIKTADATDWWRDSARKRMPLYRRLQSRAAATYGDKGYVPVVEDPLVGVDRLAERISDNLIKLGETDPVDFYSLFDPYMYMAYFEGADATDVYLGRKGLYDLPACVNNKLNPPQSGDEPPRGGDGSPSSLPGGSGSEYLYSYELFFGNFEEPGARRCEDLKRVVSPRLNERLEVIADSIFGNMDGLYSLYNLATEVEIDVVYADNTGTRLKSDFDNNIEVALSETFSQADVDSVYRGMCGLLADIITSQEIDLDPDDSDIDADDLLNEMEIPVVTIARPNSSDFSNLKKVLQDLKAISDGDESVGDLDALKSAYEECMGSEIGQWDKSQYVGESKEEADLRRMELAEYIGLSQYLPYDISYALDDSDFKRLLDNTLYDALDVQNEYTTKAEQIDQLRRRLVDTYRAIVFPKYFPQDGIRVVHITRKEADDFTREHHSLLGGDSKEINPRGLELTIGAEVDGKLVAVAVANTPPGRGTNQLRETDLSRVASDGSVKKVSSLLAGIVLQLTLENKLSRDPTSSPLFITYSTIDEVGSTYMALLNMGLRPVSLSTPASKPSGARQGSGMGDVYAYPKIRWEAGDDAAPANLDIARFLKLSYATAIETDPQMESVGEPWGDNYICLCILSTVRFPKSCKAYIDELRDGFREYPKARGTSRVRTQLMSYAQDQIERSGPQRSKNIKRYMRPITLCGQITKNETFTPEGLRSVRRNIQRIKEAISRLDAPDGCKKSDVTNALKSWDKSLNT